MPVTSGLPNTVTCTGSAECAPLGDACNIGECVGNRCVAGVANEGGSCDDGIGCTDPDTCSIGVCNGGMDNCTGGQTCNHTTGLCSTGPVTVTFQQGVGGYTGVVDTYIDSALGSQAATTPIVVDGDPVEQVLLRFDGIIGSGADQIPQGSTISSATLTLRVGSGTNDMSANPVNFHGLLHPWLDTDVWAAYGVSPWNATGGIQADGADAVGTADATATMSTVSTAYPVSVTGSVQAWATTPSSNYGWTILPTGADGLRLESSESTTASYRPLLTVIYTPGHPRSAAWNWTGALRRRSPGKARGPTPSTTWSPASW